MISTILVATDGSDASAAAEQYGVALAARLRARVMGISVVEDRLARGLQESGLGVTPPPPEPMAAYLKERADAACRRVTDRARADGVESSSEPTQGNADDRIVEWVSRRIWSSSDATDSTPPVGRA